jgi:hypothetical protein
LNMVVKRFKKVTQYKGEQGLRRKSTSQIVKSLRNPSLQQSNQEWRTVLKGYPSEYPSERSEEVGRFGRYECGYWVDYLASEIVAEFRTTG